MVWRGGDLLQAKPRVFPRRPARLLSWRSSGSFRAAVWEEKKDLWLSVWELKRLEILPAKDEIPLKLG